MQALLKASVSRSFFSRLVRSDFAFGFLKISDFFQKFFVLFYFQCHCERSFNVAAGTKPTANYYIFTVICYNLNSGSNNISLFFRFLFCFERSVFENKTSGTNEPFAFTFYLFCLFFSSASLGDVGYC